MFLEIGQRWRFNCVTTDILIEIVKIEEHQIQGKIVQNWSQVEIHENGFVLNSLHFFCSIPRSGIDNVYWTYFQGQDKII
jgi:hypothetical protein